MVLFTCYMFRLMLCHFLLECNPTRMETFDENLPKLKFDRRKKLNDDDEIAENNFLVIKDPDMIEGNDCDQKMTDLILDTLITSVNLAKNWTLIYKTHQQRFDNLETHFNSKMRPFFNKLNPSHFVSKGKKRYYLDFKQRDTPCFVVFIGIGLNFTGETKFQNRHKQCKFLVVDPDERNRQLVENLRNKFIHTGASDINASSVALIKKSSNSTKMLRKTVQHEDIVQLLNKHNPKRKMIDLLVLNAKGAEPIIIPHIMRNSKALPSICQINIEIHLPLTSYNHSLATFVQFLTVFLQNSEFVLLNVDKDETRNQLRLYLVNLSEKQCLDKFLCSIFNDEEINY